VLRGFILQISFHFKANSPILLTKKIGRPLLHNVRYLCGGLNLLTSLQVVEFVDCLVLVQWMAISVSSDWNCPVNGLFTIDDPTDILNHVKTGSWTLSCSLTIHNSVCCHFPTRSKRKFCVYFQWWNLMSTTSCKIFNLFKRNSKLLWVSQEKNEENSYQIQNILKKSEIFTKYVFYGV